MMPPSSPGIFSDDWGDAITFGFFCASCITLLVFLATDHSGSDE